MSFVGPPPIYQDPPNYVAPKSLSEEPPKYVSAPSYEEHFSSLPDYQEPPQYLPPPPYSNASKLASQSEASSSELSCLVADALRSTQLTIKADGNPAVRRQRLHRRLLVTHPSLFSDDEEKFERFIAIEMQEILAVKPVSLMGDVVLFRDNAKTPIAKLPALFTTEDILKIVDVGKWSALYVMLAWVLKMHPRDIVERLQFPLPDFKSQARAYEFFFSVGSSVESVAYCTDHFSDFLLKKLRELPKRGAGRVFPDSWEEAIHAFASLKDRLSLHAFIHSAISANGRDPYTGRPDPPRWSMLSKSSRSVTKARSEVNQLLQRLTTITPDVLRELLEAGLWHTSCLLLSWVFEEAPEKVYTQLCFPLPCKTKAPVTFTFRDDISGSETHKIVLGADLSPITWMVIERLHDHQVDPQDGSSLLLRRSVSPSPSIFSGAWPPSWFSSAACEVLQSQFQQCAARYGGKDPFVDPGDSVRVEPMPPAIGERDASSIQLSASALIPSCPSSDARGPVAVSTTCIPLAVDTELISPQSSTPLKRRGGDPVALVRRGGDCDVIQLKAVTSPSKKRAPRPAIKPSEDDTSTRTDVPPQHVHVPDEISPQSGVVESGVVELFGLRESERELTTSLEQLVSEVLIDSGLDKVEEEKESLSPAPNPKDSFDVQYAELCDNEPSFRLCAKRDKKSQTISCLMCLEKSILLSDWEKHASTDLHLLLWAASERKLFLRRQGKYSCHCLLCDVTVSEWSLHIDDSCHKRHLHTLFENLESHAKLLTEVVDATERVYVECTVCEFRVALRNWPHHEGTSGHQQQLHPEETSMEKKHALKPPPPPSSQDAHCEIITPKMVRCTLCQSKPIPITVWTMHVKGKIHRTLLSELAEEESNEEDREQEEEVVTTVSGDEVEPRVSPTPQAPTAHNLLKQSEFKSCAKVDGWQSFTCRMCNTPAMPLIEWDAHRDGPRHMLLWAASGIECFARRRTNTPHLVSCGLCHSVAMPTRRWQEHVDGGIHRSNLTDLFESLEQEGASYKSDTHVACDHCPETSIPFMEWLTHVQKHHERDEEDKIAEDNDVHEDEDADDDVMKVVANGKKVQCTACMRTMLPAQWSAHKSGKAHQSTIAAAATTPKTTSSSSAVPTSKGQLCGKFLCGLCRFKSKCFKVHPEGPTQLKSEFWKHVHQLTSSKDSGFDNIPEPFYSLLRNAIGKLAGIPEPSSTVTPKASKNIRLCHLYYRRQCKAGKKCMFSHSTSASVLTARQWGETIFEMSRPSSELHRFVPKPFQEYVMHALNSCVAGAEIEDEQYLQWIGNGRTIVRCTICGTGGIPFGNWTMHITGGQHRSEIRSQEKKLAGAESKLAEKTETMKDAKKAKKQVAKKEAKTSTPPPPPLNSAKLPPPSKNEESEYVRVVLRDSSDAASSTSSDEYSSNRRQRYAGLSSVSKACDWCGATEGPAMLSRPSEFEEARCGPLIPCEGCDDRWYCSINCREQDWVEGHDLECDSAF